jgi:hypothetical protein
VLIRFAFRARVRVPEFAALENANTFNQTLSPTTAPVTFSGSSNLFNTTIQCPVNGALSVTASASLDAGANVNATVSLGAVAAGTIVPPEMTEFGLYFGAYRPRLSMPGRVASD